MDPHKNVGRAIMIAIGICVIVYTLVALIAVKASTDVFVIYAAVIGLSLIFVGERVFLHTNEQEN